MNAGRRMAQIPKDDFILSPSKDEHGQALEFIRPAYIRTSFFTAHDPSPLQKITEVCVRSSAASRRLKKGWRGTPRRRAIPVLLLFGSNRIGMRVIPRPSASGMVARDCPTLRTARIVSPPVHKRRSAPAGPGGPDRL